MRPNLRLKKEALSDLTTEELVSVAGAQWTPGCPLFIRIDDLLEDLTIECGRPAR